MRRILAILLILAPVAVLAPDFTWVGKPHAFNEEAGAGYQDVWKWRLWLEHVTHTSAASGCWGTSLGSPSISPAPPAYCGNDPNPPSGSDPGDPSGTPGGIQLSADTSYTMSATRTANGGDSGVAFKFASGTKLNCNGNTLNGLITINSAMPHGGVITNCILVGSPAAGTGIVNFQGGGAMTSAVFIQYTNCTVNPGSTADNTRCFNVDSAPSSVTTADGFAIEFLFDTVTESVSGISREYAMNAQGNNNNLNCSWNVAFVPATTFGGQGCVSQSHPSKIWINNNWFVAATNTSGQDPRLADVDAAGQPMESSCAGIDREMNNNILYARNGRALRDRTVNCVQIKGNTIYDAATNDVGAIHIGDDNKPTFDAFTYLDISNNTFVSVQSGVIALIGIRSASGVTSHDNAITSFSGTPVFANVTNLSAMGNPTGTVNTNGTTTVTWASGGSLFSPAWPGLTITIAGTNYTIVSVASAQNTLVTNTAVPTATGAAFSVNTGPLTSQATFTRDPVLANPNITVTGVDANDPAAATICNSGVGSQGVFATVTTNSNSTCPALQTIGIPF